MYRSMVWGSGAVFCPYAQGCAVSGLRHQAASSSFLDVFCMCGISQGSSSMVVPPPKSTSARQAPAHCAAQLQPRSPVRADSSVIVQVCGVLHGDQQEQLETCSFPKSPNGLPEGHQGA